MLDAAREAITFTEGRTRADLEVDRMLVLALVKEIEIVGEAASQISQEAREQLPNIPWPDIVGMRHRLVHAYFDINLEILWQTVQSDLPPLIAELEQILRAASS
jgi:uncharacterized protein with HEPN domain